MGQAKIRAAMRQKTEEQIAGFDFQQLASAIHRLVDAAGTHQGVDCYTQALLASEILLRHGITAEIAVGFAAFRVGNGDGDVITHAPMPGMPYQPNAAAYHAWIEIGDWIFDTTTSQLRQKAADLDALDGGTTTVDWCPDYLLVQKSSVSTFRQVTCEHAGMYFYERRQDVEDLILTTAPETCETDVQAAIALFENPEIIVIGPNNSIAAGDHV